MVDIPYTSLEHAGGLQPPGYATEGSSGFDLAAAIDKPWSINSGVAVLIPTGLVFDIPRGFELQIRPRSGLALNHSVTIVNSPGTIDSDYRGEVKIILINHGFSHFTIMPGMRIAQAVLAKVERAYLKWYPADCLTQTNRGAGGFGSTGT